MMNGRVGVAAKWPDLHKVMGMVNKRSVPRDKYMKSQNTYYLTVQTREIKSGG